MANGNFGGGTGIANDPYLVEDAADLNAVRNNLSAHYLQVADIDLSEYENWEPIGRNTTTEDRFTGVYNGNFYKITNLNINKPNEDYVGLFGYSTNNIRNVNLTIGKIIGKTYVGAIAGVGSMVESCTVTTNSNDLYNIEGQGYVGGVCGSIIGSSTKTSLRVENIKIFNSGQYTGGIGGNIEGILRNSSFKGMIQGGDRVGGIGGHISASTSQGYTTQSCYVDGEINGNTYVGGIAGSVTGFGSYIEDCYVNGNISGTSYVGGIVGINGSTSTGGSVGRVIRRCYTNCNIHGNSYVGGIVGYTDFQGINHCYALGQKIVRVSGTSSTFGRVYGSARSTVPGPNYALDTMEFIT